MYIKRLTGIIMAVVATLAVQADVLVNFDFENHDAGAALGGPVRTPRINTSGDFGDGFDYDDHAVALNVTVSQLSASDNSSTGFNRTGANVRADTVAATVPGGNFLELSPHRLEDQSYGDELYPAGTVDYLTFSVEVDEGYKLNLSQFSFDLGVARGAADTASVSFRGKGWFSVDGGASWTAISGTKSLSNTEAQSFTSFKTYSTSLSAFEDLQGITHEVLFALALSDNSGRTLYSSNNVSPVGYYIDNLSVEGAVSEDNTLPLGLLTRFDFENHSPGDLVPAPVGSPRVLNGRGDIFPYTPNGAVSNITVSSLSEIGPSDLDDSVAAYICEDTLAITQPGGNFLGWSPHRLRTTGDDGDIDPSITDTNDSLQFTVSPDAGKVLNIDELTFDIGCVVATSDLSDTNEVIFRAQGWYSLDDGASWTKIQETQLNITTNRQVFEGFTTYSADLSDITELQGVAGNVVFAIGVNNNSGRLAHNNTGIYNPAEFYMDNINLYGSVNDLPAATPVNGIRIEGSDVILTWDTLASFDYNVWTNLNLVNGEWGVTDTVSGNGGEISWTSLVSEAEALFYKVERSEQEIEGEL